MIERKSKANQSHFPEADWERAFRGCAIALRRRVMVLDFAAGAGIVSVSTEIVA